MPERIIDVLKWFSTLSANAKLNVVLALIFMVVGYYVYRRENYITLQDGRIISLNERCAANDSILQKALEDCNTKMYNKVEEVSKYYRERVERLEERSSTNHRNIQEIKEN